MWNNRASKHGRTSSSTHGRWRAVSALVVALLPAMGAAQGTTGPVTVLTSGLHSIYGGHALQLLATETGSPDSVTEVTIEFRDATDHQRAFKVATMTRARPAALRLPIPAGVGRDTLRAIVTFRALVHGESSAPIVVLEDLDPGAFQVVPKVVCAVIEPLPGGPAEGDCDGWRVNRLAVGPPTVPN